jgi:hypothetical protein
VQDMVTLLMIERTLKDLLFIGNTPLTLAEITPTPEKKDKPFNKPVPCLTGITVPFHTKVTHEADYVEFIKKQYEGHYAIEGNRIILKYKVTSDNTKLKDIGKYRRYFYDRRLRGLLIWKYPPTIEIKYAAIEAEIRAYEQYRPSIVKLLYELETTVIDGCALDIAPGKNHIPFNRIIDTIKDKLPEHKDQSDTLLHIRNAVFHNQFPAFEEAIETAEGGSIAEKMKTITEHYIEQIMRKGILHV